MPKAKTAKVKTIQEKKEVSNEVSIEKTGPMTKEEWCKANDIARPGSNYAETEYAKYIASLA